MANESKRLRYVGPIDEISIPALGVSVKRNHHLAVEDREIAASLLEQADWEEVGKAKPKDVDAPADPPKEG